MNPLWLITVNRHERLQPVEFPKVLENKSFSYHWSWQCQQGERDVKRGHTSTCIKLVGLSAEKRLVRTAKTFLYWVPQKEVLS